MRTVRLIRILLFLLLGLFGVFILSVWRSGHSSHSSEYISGFDPHNFLHWPGIEPVLKDYQRLQKNVRIDDSGEQLANQNNHELHHHHLHKGPDGQLVPGEKKDNPVEPGVLAEVAKAAEDSNTVKVRGGGILVDNLATQNQHTFKFPPLSPSEAEKLPIFPFETNSSTEDRIWNQMRYIPKQLIKGENVKEKVILFYNGMGIEEGGRQGLRSRNCPVKACDLTGDRSRFSEADVVLWQYSITVPFQTRPPNQIWAVFYLESPYHTGGFGLPNINWTATYLRSSTIVSPYYKFTPYDQTKDHYTAPHYMPKRNYAEGKSKKVAWFVSNCGAPNNRLQYARKLANYIQVDIYGGCGTHSCPRSSAESCFKKLTTDYKFYLSFENSNCRDYITEKLFQNGLANDVLPVVMGAHPDDYHRSAPFHSYIHVDDFESPQQLAEYLDYLDKNDTAYNTYFSWKGSGLVDTNTFFICRLCMMAHEADNTRSILNHVEVNREWKESCTTKPWVTPKSAQEHISLLQAMPFLPSKS